LQLTAALSAMQSLTPAVGYSIITIQFQQQKLVHSGPHNGTVCGRTSAVDNLGNERIHFCAGVSGPWHTVTAFLLHL